MATRGETSAHLRFVLGFSSLVSFGIWFATAFHALPTLSWEPVRGTVLAAVMEVKTLARSKGPDIHTVVAHVTIRYAFQGREWTSDLRIPLSRAWKEGDARSEDYVPEYPPGKVVDAFADPESPFNVEARRGPHPATWLALLAGLGCGVGWWRARRRASPAAA